MNARRLAAVWLAVLVGHASAQVSQVPPVPPAQQGPGVPPELMQALRQGGYVIYFRHGHTHWQQKILEQAMMAEGRHDLANCATQRNLDAQGRAEAARIAAALQAERIPVGEVLASLYCRPADYVALITGKVPQRVRWLTGLSTPESLRAIKRAVATPPAPGTNTVLGGHGDRPFELSGLVIQEGDALVFDPHQHRVDDPGKFKPIAWITPALWGPAVPAAAKEDAAAARRLQLARENPAKNIEPRMTSAGAEWAMAATKPWAIGAGLTTAPGQDRAWFSAEHANLWGADHQAALTASPSLRGASRNVSLAYRAPLPSFATMLGLVVTHADAAAGLDAELVPITTPGRRVSVYARVHLAPLADYHHHVQLTIADRTAAHPTTIAYAGHWEEEWTGWKFETQAAFGLPEAGSGSRGEPLRGDHGRALRARAEWLRVLTYDIRLRLAGRAAWSSRTLDAGEQFALGAPLAPWGSAFGVWERAPWLHRTALRGLPERALTGERGAAGVAELWSRRLFGQDLRTGAYLEAGRARRVNGGTSRATGLGLALHHQQGGRVALAASVGRLWTSGAAPPHNSTQAELTMALRW